VELPFEVSLPHQTSIHQSDRLPILTESSFLAWLTRNRGKRAWSALTICCWKTDIVRTWRRRFEKNRNTLFTFLDHDGIPWNNNNAEHAVKKFALLRDVIGGTCTESGIREYLILLSVCESCNLKGIRFLEFVRSGETSLEGFLARQRSSLAGAARQERGDT
jgi:hypothetical protein